MSAPPPGDPSAGGRHRLAPIACRHRQRSGEMILRAAQAAAPGRAAVLGAGACEEIPLAELAARFDEVTLNDVDEQPLRSAVDALDLPEAARGKLRIEMADLSGLTQPALAAIDQLLAVSSGAASAIEAMSAAVRAAEPAEFPITGRRDLVVASCVLSQLHFGLTHQAGARFAARFPDAEERLRASRVWKAALYDTARGMEDRFVGELTKLVTDDGVVYLSESVQMCYVQLGPDGQWQTEGTYRMLRTKDLADYVRGQFAIEQRGRWEWIVDRPAVVGDVGRMYDVQALVLRRGGG